MITKKNVMIPIFNVAMTIVIFDKYEEILEWKCVKDLGEDDIKSPGLTICGYERNCTVFIEKSNMISTICHEAHHIRTFVFESIGYTPSLKEDEFGAYLIAWISERIYEVMKRHNAYNKL